MEITSKGRYAVRVMADIARNENNYVSITDISKRQNITPKYLEKIIAMLVKANLVESMRGANGGYKLNKKPIDYTIKEILNATGDSTQIATCQKGVNCPMADCCDSQGVWNTLSTIIDDYLESITLQDLIDKTYNKK